MESADSNQMVFPFVIQVLGIICIALLRYYNLNFGGEWQQTSAQDRYIFGVIAIGGMLIVTIPIFIAHILGSEIRPGLVRSFTNPFKKKY